MCACFRLFVVLALLAFSAGAHADDVLSQLAPANSDVALQILRSVLGPIDTGVTPANPIAAAMGAFNRCALAFGTLLFTYVAVIGTLNTAHDGELLGRKWSSMWIPLRFTVGIAFMVPAAGGWSGAQWAVVKAAEYASSAASWAWTESVTQLANGGSAMAGKFDSADYAFAVDASVRTIWRAEACSAAWRDRLNLADSVFGLSTVQQADGSYIVRWGDRSGGVAAPDACGSLQTSAYRPAQTSGESVLAGFDGPEIATAVPAATGQSMQGIIDAQVKGVVDAATILRPSATAAAGACGAAGRPACSAGALSQSGVSRAIAQADATYTADVQPAVASAYASMTDGQQIAQQATSRGWAMAGTVMFRMAQQQSRINALTGWMPTVTPPSASAASEGLLLSDIDDAGWNSRLADVTDSIWHAPGRSLMQQLALKLGVDPRDKRHVLVQVKDAGDWLMVGTQGAAVAAGAVNSIPVVQTAVQGIAARVPGLGGLAAQLAAAGELAVKAMYGMGTTMSTVLPMLPFILWWGSLVGWLFAVVELLIAAPLWMMGHLHPEGHEVAGKGVGGYLILLEVVARPILLVVSFWVAFYMCDQLCRWLAYFYFGAVGDVQSDSVTGITSVVVFLGLYLMLLFTTIRTCFGLMHAIPSQLMRYIGGAHASHDQAGAFGNNVAAQNNPVASAAGGASLGIVKTVAHGYKSAPVDVGTKSTVGEIHPGNR